MRRLEVWACGTVIRKSGFWLRRSGLVAPLVVLIVDDRMGLALAVYTVCAGTDVVDGIVARRRGQRTDFGTMMDPAADIISTAAVFAAFWATSAPKPCYLQAFG